MVVHIIVVHKSYVGDFNAVSLNNTLYMQYNSEMNDILSFHFSRY